MIDVSELIKQFASSNFTAGASGGFVRNIYAREAWTTTALRSVAGGLSAHFLTPLILWFAMNEMELEQAEIIAVSTPMGIAISFSIGLLGIALSSIVERILTKRAGL